MKTEPMKHQLQGELLLANAPEYYALGAEQGTGKTWMLLNDAERQWRSGRIQALLVLAPKGVHTNWVLRQIPEHLSVKCAAESWISGAGKRHAAKLERLLRWDPEDGLAVLAMNIDAINTKAGFEMARRFLQKFRCMFVVDESHQIKNPQASRTKRVLSLAPFAVSRRIASGTLVPNNPLDLFAQFEFLRSGLLGTTSYRAFVAQYAELLPDNSKLVQAIRSKARGGNPQVIKRDSDGNPVFRNLERLRALMSPHTYRVLKKECLDLPEKIYNTHYFELSPSQQKLYDKVKEESRYTKEDGEIDLYSALTLINKLRQITSGFIIADNAPVTLPEAQPRLEALAQLVASTEGQIIIWASFVEEIAQIAQALSDQTIVQYYGAISDADRELAVDKFQRGEARIFLANPAVGGTGLTLTAADAVIYYSNSYNLGQRLQSEDRAHRIGTRHNVVYTDLVATGTIDERIASALQTKNLVASYVLDGKVN